MTHPETVLLLAFTLSSAGALNFMLKEAAFTYTGAACGTVKLVAVADVISAFAAFYGSINELKHERSTRLE